MPRQKAASTEAGTDTQTTSKKNGAKSRKNDAVSLLKADHRNVEALFEKFEKTEDSDQKEKIAKKICNELITHAQLEEEIFYPACREHGVESDTLDEAQVEHDGAKVMINELLTASPDDEFYDAKVTVLKEYIRHHVNEEEKARGGIFAQARKADMDMDEIGQRLQTLKEQITAKADETSPTPPEYRALHLQQSQQRSPQETRMNRQRGYGSNFDDDDDDRQYSGRYTGNYARQGSRQGSQQDYQGRQQSQQGSRQRSGGGYGAGSSSYSAGSSGGYGGSDYDEGSRYSRSTGNQQSQWNQEQGYGQSGGYGGSTREGRGTSRNQGYGQDYGENRQFGSSVRSRNQQRGSQRRDWEDTGSYGQGDFEDEGYGSASRGRSSYGQGSGGGSYYGSGSSRGASSGRGSSYSSSGRSSFEDDDNQNYTQSSRAGRRGSWSDEDDDDRQRSNRSSWND